MRWFRMVAAACVLLPLPAAVVLQTISAQAAAGVVVLSSSQWVESPSGAVHIVGEVRNDGSDNATLIRVNLKLNVSSGSPGKSFTFAAASILGPGESSPFEEILFPPPANYTGFSLDAPPVTQARSTSPPDHNFSFTLDACPNLDPASAACQALIPRDGHITGTVTNDSNAITVDDVEAIFTFRDGGGTVVAQNTTPVIRNSDQSSTLGPLESGHFDLDREGEPSSWTGAAMLAEPSYPVLVDPSSLDFGKQLVGVSSATQDLTVFNTGPRAATIAVSTTGDFHQTNSCGTSLAASASCTISTSFLPTDLDSRLGTLVITNNAAGSPQQIPLTGIGVKPIASLPPAVNLGSQAVKTVSAPTPVLLKNTGTAPMGISAIATTGDFAQVNDCGSSLAEHSQCTINVTFTPTNGGPRTGTLSVTDTADGSPHSASLSGTGIGLGLDPTALDFGNQPVGVQSGAKTISLTNDQAVPLNNLAVAATGDFQESDNCPSPLPAGGNCTLSVEFTPTVLGQRNGRLTITDDASDSPRTVALSGVGVATASLTPSSLDFGQVNLLLHSARTITLANLSNSPMTITSIVTSGEYKESDQCPNPLPKNSSCDLTVTFTPTRTGADNGTLTIHDNAGTGTQIVPLSGTGVSTWESLGGILTSAPTATAAGPDRLDVFVRGSDNALYQKTWNGMTWSGWNRLGGILTSDPAAVSSGNGRIDVFVAGRDNALYQKTFDGAKWSDWVRLGGILTSRPAAATRSAGTMDVFVRGWDNALYQNTSVDGTKWNGWIRLGGILVAPPAVTSAASGHLDVFVSGRDNALYWKTFDGSKWSEGWVRLGGILRSAPAAASSGPKRLDVFVLGYDSKLYHKAFDGSTWSGWDALGGPWTSDPSAVSRLPGTLDVFERGPDQGLWHRPIASS